MSRDVRFPTMWCVRPAKAQTSMRSLIRAFASRLNCQGANDRILFGVAKLKRLV